MLEAVLNWFANTIAILPVWVWILSGIVIVVGLTLEGARH